MKKIYITTILLLVQLYLFAQIDFEKGYYINNNGKKIECLIKNIDWLYNPEKIIIKLNGQEKRLNIDDIKEFQIYNGKKFIRLKVDIDRTPTKVKGISYDSTFNFQEETLLLQVLVEGKANLYSYRKGELYFFFFNKENNTVKQLLYREYNKYDDLSYYIVEKETFKSQLYAKLKSKKLTLRHFKNLEYKEKDLIKLFNLYNGNNSIENKVEKKETSNFSIRPGLNYSAPIEVYLPMLGIINNKKINSKLNFRLGLELEFILPFNKNKWAFTLEPTFQLLRFQNTFSTNAYAGINEYTIESTGKYLTIPIGIRYYLFLNKSAKLFLNGSVGLSLNLGTKISVSYPERTYDYKFKNQVLSFGIGFKKNDKISCEIKTEMGKGSLIAPEEKFNQLSFEFIIGYTLFNNK